jgi:TRAP-type C4-dicarboxylate transport system substrate-binding protein
LVLAFKLYEVAKYGTIATFGCVTEGVIMNQKSWNKTPDDLKPIIEEVCSNPFRTSGGLTVDVYKTMMKELADNGVELYYLSEKEEDRWYSRFQEETKKWAKDLEAKGLPAKKTVSMYNEECEKRGVECVACPPEWE